MQTIKLHEATKQFGISNKLAMFFLEKKSIPVKSHSSVISMEQLELLREFANVKDKSGTVDSFGFTIEVFAPPVNVSEPDALAILAAGALALAYRRRKANLKV